MVVKNFPARLAHSFNSERHCGQMNSRKMTSHPLILGTSSILSLLLLCLSLAPSHSTSQRKKNVLFIVADDLRPQLPNYDCLQCADMITPNLKKFASFSSSPLSSSSSSSSTTTFLRAFSNQAMCGPSRTSFLTGRRPDSTKLYDQSHHYWRHFHRSGNFTTIPQFFKDNGYRVASFGKIFHPGRASGRADDYPYSWTDPPYHPPSQKFKVFSFGMHLYLILGKQRFLHRFGRKVGLILYQSPCHASVAATKFNFRSPAS